MHRVQRLSRRLDTFRVDANDCSCSSESCRWLEIVYLTVSCGGRTMFSILVLTQADLKKKHEEMLREHATNHHPVPKVHKCSPAHPCAALAY